MASAIACLIFVGCGHFCHPYRYHDVIRNIIDALRGRFVGGSIDNTHAQFGCISESSVVMIADGRVWSYARSACAGCHPCPDCAQSPFHFIYIKHLSLRCTIFTCSTAITNIPTPVAEYAIVVFVYARQTYLCNPHPKLMVIMVVFVQFICRVFYCTLIQRFRKCGALIAKDQQCVLYCVLVLTFDVCLVYQISNPLRTSESNDACSLEILICAPMPIVFATKATK